MTCQSETMVDVSIIKEAFDDSDISLSELARRLDWTRTKSVLDTRWNAQAKRRRVEGFADISRVKRALGMMPYNPGHGRANRYRSKMSESQAIIILEALGLDPHEVGL